MRKFAAACAPVSILMLLTGYHATAAENPVSGQDWIALHLRSQARAGAELKLIRDRMIKLFRRKDLDGNGLSEVDYQLDGQMKAAQRRAATISRWLRFDLDGNGSVTRKELEQVLYSKARTPIRRFGTSIIPTDDQVRQTLNKLVHEQLKMDGNGDGAVTFEEALSYSNEKEQKRLQSAKGGSDIRLLRQQIPLSLDQDGDGSVSEQEFMKAVDLVLGRIDRDNDGEVGSVEASAFRASVKSINAAFNASLREQRKQSRILKRAQSCRFPAAPAKAEVVLFGAHEGQALSTVALGNDAATVTVANVEIEPGATPLYVALVSHRPMIWQFSGALERVAQVVALAQRSDENGAARVGVIGLPRGRVFIPEDMKCLGGFYKPDSPQARQNAELLRQAAGIDVDLLAGDYSVARVQLPSGRIHKNAPFANAVRLATDGPAASVWQEMLRFNPGGLVEIEAKSVVSRAQARTYAVLPQEAGLAQLVEAGALKVIGTLRSIRIGDLRDDQGSFSTSLSTARELSRRVSNIPKKYMVLKKFTFPAGLSGAHAVQFVLGPGVPRPDGSPGHSSVTE